MGKHFKKILIISIAISVLVIVGAQLPFIYNPVRNLIDPVTQEDISNAVEEVYLNEDEEEESYAIYGSSGEEQYGTFSRRYSDANVFMKIETKLPPAAEGDEYPVFIKNFDDGEDLPYNIGSLKKDGESYTLNSIDLVDAFGDIQVYITGGFENGVDVDSAILKTEVISKTN